MFKRFLYLACIVLIVSLTSKASAQLLAHYKFDEISGNIAVDSSIKGNDGIIEKIDEDAEGGDPNWVVDGIYGALSFDGNMDVNLPAANMGLRSDTGTVAFWMKLNDVASTGTINTMWWAGETSGGGFGPENQTHFQVEIPVTDIWVGGEFGFYLRGDPNNVHLHSDPNKGDAPGVAPVSPILVDDNQWYHIVGTWGNEDGDAKLYYNGRLLHSIAYDWTNISYPFNRMFLGRMGRGSRQYYGILDDVQIYGRALSLDEIQDVMSAGVALTLPASLPLPANNASDVPRDTLLSWTEGDTADKHNVYFGTNFNDVNEATMTDPRSVLVGQNQEELSFDPFGSDLLDYGITYFWRIDEVEADGVTINKGNIWQFTVANFIVVDDFESYNDLDPEEEGSNRIFNIWADGWEIETNGATVGYSDPDFENGEHFVETTIINTGKQSMPYFYDNNMKYSEAAMGLTGSASNWTRDGVNELSLWFIGAPGPVGSFVEEPAGTYTMTAGGADIWGNADECHFAYKEMTGAVTIRARVDSLDNTDPYAKAGVMVRDTLEPGARNCSLLITPENGVRFQYRNAADGITNREFDPNVAVPYWVRLERTTGGLIRAYYSPNGNDWTSLPLKQVSMGMPIYVGLAVTSHNTEAVCQAVISNVTITGTGSDSAWTAQDVGITSNSSQPLYVALNDNAIIYNNDPSPTQIDEWTQWNIPLQDFASQGATLSNISKIAIGVGTQGDTSTLGGTGTLFFDNIRLYRPPITDGN